MKYLVVIAVIAFVLWLVRNKRPASDRTAAAPQPPALPQDMVRCPVCSVHLPSADALIGADGKLYCSPEHRQRAGK